MVLIETYENSSLFDMTYLHLVWLSILPNFLNPVMYGVWVMSPTMKKRLRGYLRLTGSANSDTRKTTLDVEMSTTATTTTTNPPVLVSTIVTADSKHSGGHRLSVAAAGAIPPHSRSPCRSDTSSSNSSSLFSLLQPKIRMSKQPKTGFARSTEVLPPEYTTSATANRAAVVQIKSDRRGSDYSTSAERPLINSCSDITTSTLVGGSIRTVGGSVTALGIAAATDNSGAIGADRHGDQRHRMATYAAGANKRGVHMPYNYHRAYSPEFQRRKSSTTGTPPPPPPLRPLHDLDEGGDFDSDADYAESLCPSVSTTTNELEIEALERRRSLVSPDYLPDTYQPHRTASRDGRQQQQSFGQKSTYRTADRHSGEFLWVVERMEAIGKQ